MFRIYPNCNDLAWTCSLGSESTIPMTGPTTRAIPPRTVTRRKLGQINSAIWPMRSQVYSFFLRLAVYCSFSLPVPKRKTLKSTSRTDLDRRSEFGNSNKPSSLLESRNLIVVLLYPPTTKNKLADLVFFFFLLFFFIVQPCVWKPPSPLPNPYLV